MQLYQLIAVILLFFTGCGHFKPTQLKKQNFVTTLGTYDSSTVSIKTHHLQDTDLSSAARTITATINLLALTVKNKTDKPLSLDPASIYPRIMCSDELKALIPKTYGCYFIPAAVVGFSGFLFLWQVGLPLAGLLTLFGINQSHRAADRTLTSTTKHLLEPGQLKYIAPHSTETFLIAIKRDEYQPALTLHVGNKDDEEVCTVTCNKSMHTSYALS